MISHYFASFDDKDIFSFSSNKRGLKEMHQGPADFHIVPQQQQPQQQQQQVHQPHHMMKKDELEPFAKRMRHDESINCTFQACTGNNWWRFGAIERETITRVANDPCWDDSCEAISPELVFPDPSPPSVSRVQADLTEVDGLLNQNLISPRPNQMSQLSNLPTLLNECIAMKQPPLTLPVASLTDAKSANNKSTKNNGNNNKRDTSKRFRSYQAENWTEKYEELLDFRLTHGHCLVPNCFPINPSLAEWVRRQRYQYKLLGEGKHSTMSGNRIQALEMLGFVWNSHEAVWEERRKELEEYRKLHNDCNVPSNYVNRQLAIWIKRQRRQYKFLCNGQPSTMTQYRIQRLEELGFAWDGRNPSNNVTSPAKDAPVQNSVAATQA